MAAVNEKVTAKSRQEFYDTKLQAVEYYNKNGVPQKIEEILNSMFYENPNDVYGHMANYFEAYAKTPLISKVKTCRGLDSRGQPTLQTSVFCNIKNIQQCVSTVVSTNPVPCTLDEREAEESERKEDLIACIGLIENDIDGKLDGIDPCQQSDIDILLYEFVTKKKEDADALLINEEENESPDLAPPPLAESPAHKKKLASGKKGKTASLIIVVPDEHMEKFLPGSSVVSVLSQAVCCGGAFVKHIPLYQYVSSLYSPQSTDSLSLPLPMITILQAGKASQGKLKCVKEFMIIPKPGMTMIQAVEHIQGIYNHIGKTLCNKGGAAARYVNDIGALCPVLEKPEQGLDLLQEAITSLGLKPGEDFHIGLNVAAHEMFEYDKGKYEVMTGQLKTSDDLVEFWVDIVSRYPSVLVLIDPIRKQESSQWMKLCDRISTQCYIMGDYVYHRPGLLKSEELSEYFQSSGIVYKLEQMNTLTDLFTCVHKMEEAKNVTVLTTNQSDATDSFIVDLAVGIGARFLKIGAPCRGERIIKLNRLVQIEEELQESGKLSIQSEHVIPRIDLPPPLEGEEEQPIESPTQRKDGKKK